MSRRPPFTVVAYIALVLAVLLAALIDSGADARVLLGGVVVGALLAGLWFRIRLVWLFVTSFRAGSLLWVLLGGKAWWIAAILIVELALLLSPPTRSYFRRDPLRATKPRSRIVRVMRVGAAGLAGIGLGLVGYAVLFPPDPVSGDLDLVRSHRPGLRVLFVGNSLTYYNGMTGLVRDLAEGDPGAPAIFAVQYARGGSTLEDALDDSQLTELLEGERWRAVVLQEHSKIASRRDDLETRMYPAAYWLDRMVRKRGARTVLFESWGYEDGDGDVDDDSYEAMQARVVSNYLAVGSRLSSLIAPVGVAWQETVRRRPAIELWNDDGIHPSRAGSYLTACVFYALLTGRDPADSSFTAELDPAEARWLARLANNEVRRHYPL